LASSPIDIQGAKTVLFADYTNIQIKAPNEDILNKKKNKQHYVAVWFHVLNWLVINTEKIIAMLCHTRQIKSF
jgi:transketolase N-terminal domain/subunit